MSFFPYIYILFYKIYIYICSKINVKKYIPFRKREKNKKTKNEKSYLYESIVKARKEFFNYPLQKTGTKSI